MIDYLILILLLIVIVILFWLGSSYATINTTDLIMTREEFRDKKSKDYRKRRESYGIKDPVYLDEIEEAYYQGMVDADTQPHWISVEDELPPKKSEYDDLSNNVLATDGKEIYESVYNHDFEEWFTHDMWGLDNITYWMSMPSVEHLKDK